MPNTRLQPAVLVHYGSHRNALLITSDLARRGVRVDVAGPSRWTPARFSRFVSAFHLVPSLMEKPEEFVDAVCRICRERAIDLFLPSSYEVFTLARFRDRLWRETRYPFSSAEVTARVDDKAHISEIARAAGLAVPRFVRVSAGSDLVLPESFSFPVVYKPVVGAAGRGFGIARDAGELQRGLASGQWKGGWLVQQYVPGRLIVWHGIFHQGTLKVTFHFETLRTRPATGGASVLRRSVFVPALDGLVSRLLSAVGYEGFATLDFLEDPRTSEYWFIDFNPRFGTSIHAAMAAGVSFPYCLLRLALGEEVTPQEYPCGAESISLEGHLRRILAYRRGGPSLARLALDSLGCLSRLRQAEEFDGRDLLPLLVWPMYRLMGRRPTA